MTIVAMAIDAAPGEAQDHDNSRGFAGRHRRGRPGSPARPAPGMDDDETDSDDDGDRAVHDALAKSRGSMP